MESHLAVLADEGSSRGHRTLAEKAFETLHWAIITGRLRPGTRLPIEELAEVLDMSPMPIREAVRRLDAAGLVENIPHRGARVTELSVVDLVGGVRGAHGARGARDPARRRALPGLRRRSRPAPSPYFGGDDRRPDRRGIRRARRVSFRAVRRRRLGVADPVDPAGVGDQRALLPRGARMPAAQEAARGASRDPRIDVWRTTRTPPRSRCTIIWRRPRTTFRKRWEARPCSSLGAEGSHQRWGNDRSSSLRES